MGHITLSEAPDGVLLATVDRPPANAMDVTLLRELNEAIGEISREPPRALVLAGRPGFFSGGADLKAVPGYGPAEQREMVSGINEMALGVYELPCPVVGAITGHAIAGGLVLALCTDVRVVSTEGRYGLTEVKVGVPYPQAAIGVVAAELSPPAARALALGNELIDTAEAMRLGLFDEAVEPEQVIARALARATAMASFPPEVYARTKAELRAGTIELLRAAAARDPLLARWVG
jgi:enoyl-CoA hydratase